MNTKSLVTIISVFVSLAQSYSKIGLGSPASMLEKLILENTAVTRVYTFPTITEGQIAVNVEDYYFEAGQLSMVGRAQESKNSDFIFKGDARSLYGWLVGCTIKNGQVDLIT